MRRLLIVAGSGVLVAVGARMWGVTTGTLTLDRRMLEREQAAGRRVRGLIVGYAEVADDVPAALAQSTIDSLRVIGLLRLTQPVRRALDGRISVAGTIIVD